MGGCVAVTILDSKHFGKTVKMLRWTNALGQLFKQVGFPLKDPNTLASYMKSWEVMRDDYKAHKKNKKFKLEMTDMYFPYSCLAPCDYGLIVVDYTKNVILDMQDYDTLTVDTTAHFNVCKQDLALLQAWYSHKRLTIMKRNKYGRLQNVVFPPTFNKLKAFIRSKVAIYGFYEIHYDISPFTLEKFNKNITGAKKMLKRIRELGFTLTMKDKKQWNTFASDNEWKPLFPETNERISRQRNL